MFPSTGLFKDISCPASDQCRLLNCIFGHDRNECPDSRPTSESSPQFSTFTQEASETGSKKRRLEAVDTNDGKNTKSLEVRGDPHAKKQKLAPPSSPVSTSRRGSFTSVLRTVLPSSQLSQAKPPGISSNSNDIQKHDRVLSTVPSTSERPVVSRTGTAEKLNPRTLSKPPASHSTRFSILKLLHDVMVKLNNEVAKDLDRDSTKLTLQKEELITMALDEEEGIAKANAAVYSNVAKLRIVRFKKMTVKDWKAHVLEALSTRYNPKSTETESSVKQITTGLTPKAEIAMLKHIITPLKGLEKYGYVTSAPTSAEIDAAKKGLEAAEGWETCDRCGSRFQVFPGRRMEDGALTSGGPCKYHSSKPIYSSTKPTFYPCCNQDIAESSGCTKADTHVFKVSEVKRLASTLQFEATPQTTGEAPMGPICFDCEMGYTTLGLEIIRLSATTWPRGEKVLDVLVRPMGEILDLNSKYSGVFPEHFAKARPYTASPLNDDVPEQQGESTIFLKVVESPAAARELLFSYLRPQTPLIGHAIDNDLNTCRIIHPTIVDTVLLYPHPKGLPIRFGLKALSRKYLNRNIQMGGDRGHDSKEDAIATGDLVRVRVGERWEKLKRDGWTVKNETFYPPLPNEEPPTNE